MRARMNSDPAARTGERVDAPRNRAPALAGGLLAVTAAALFGASTPFVQKAGVGVGPFATAALLYLGAALVGAPSPPRSGP